MSTNRKEMLDQVEAAIAAVMISGQSYQIGSRKLTRANLAELKALRDELKSEECLDGDSRFFPGTVVAVFDGR